MFAGMNQVKPTGIALASLYLSKAQMDDLQSEIDNLTLEGKEMHGSLDQSVLGGNRQKDAIEAQASQMYAQGACGLTGSVLGGALEAYHLYQGYKIGQLADAPEDQTAVGADKEDVASSAPSAASAGAPVSPRAPASSSGSPAGMHDGATMDVKQQAPAAASSAAAPGTASATHAAIEANDAANEGAVLEARTQDVRDGTIRAQNTAAADNLPPPESSRSTEALNREADYHYRVGTSASQLVNGFFNSIGQLIAAGYKMVEAEATRDSQIAQGIAQALNSNLDLNRNGYQQGEQGRQELSRTMDAGVQACAAGYRA